jgi:hypothetical protein
MYIADNCWTATQAQTRGWMHDVCDQCCSGKLDTRMGLQEWNKKWAISHKKGKYIDTKRDSILEVINVWPRFV